MSSVLDETSIKTSRPGLTKADGSRSLERPLGRHGRRRLTYASTGRRAWSRRMNADADDQRHRRCDEDCWPGMIMPVIADRRCCCLQEHARHGGHNHPATSNVQRPRAAVNAGSRRATGSAVQVQENYDTHAAIDVRDGGSDAHPDQVADRSGVPSLSNPSVDLQDGRRQVLALLQ